MRINVATALNSRYMRYASVMLTSLFENQPDDLDIHIYLLYSDLTADDRNTLEGVVEAYGGGAAFIVCRQGKISGQVSSFRYMVDRNLLPADAARYPPG